MADSQILSDPRMPVLPPVPIMSRIRVGAIDRGFPATSSNPSGTKPIESGNTMTKYLTLPAFLWGVFCLYGVAPADVITLQSQGVLRGEVVEQAESPADPAEEMAESLTIETLSGTRIRVATDQVRHVERRPIILEEYELRRRQTEDTVEAQWELAEWARRNRLTDQQQVHLERVVALEPDHEAARSALGHVKQDGRWRDRAEIMAERGLVQYRRRWVTPQERDLMIKLETQREEESDWLGKVRLWHGWLRGANSQRYAEAIVEFQKIDSPTAVPALARYFGNDPNAAHRMLYIAALERIPGEEPVAPLVMQALRDVDEMVRNEALGVVLKNHRASALPYLLEGLRSKENTVVRRAGAALGKLGDRRAIPDLIKALITAHPRTIQVPEEVPSINFSSGGAFGPGGVPLPPEIEIALRTGHLPYGVNVTGAGPQIRWRTVTIRVNEENKEVLDTLTALTGESFGYDERVWQQWLLGKKSGL